MSLPPYKWEDPLGFEAALSENERLIMDSARNYAQDKLVPRIKMAHRNETFDRDVLHEFGRKGCLAAPLRAMAVRARIMSLTD